MNMNMNAHVLNDKANEMVQINVHINRPIVIPITW